MSDWHTCDGAGRVASDPQRAAMGVSRRGLIAGVGLGLLGWASTRSALAQLTVGKHKGGNTVVVVFLRGGADALSIVAPYGDEEYYRARPNLALPKRDLAVLDDTFGLHPALRPLHALYEEGKLAAVHAVGSHDATRSHFEAMDTMERGVADRVGPSSGWVARYLAASEAESASPLRAVAFGHTTPTALVGATDAVTLASLGDFQLQAPPAARQALAAMYRPGRDEVAQAGRETLQVLETLDRLDPGKQLPRNQAKYPDTGLGQALRQVATLVRADVGLEVACVDQGAYDTHVAQGTTAGWLPTLLTELGDSLGAFAQDLGKDLDRVTVVVMSEFGRRIAENTGLGTDHGHGGAMLLLGGGVKGGRVHARWPGLAERVGPGDLAATTDYRDVLAEVLAARLPTSDLSEVFAGHRATPIGLVA
ncbi:MAG: DUF1501 domain-containing protein [Fimbriimonas sp.]